MKEFSKLIFAAILAFSGLLSSWGICGCSPKEEGAGKIVETSFEVSPSPSAGSKGETEAVPTDFNKKDLYWVELPAGIPSQIKEYKGFKLSFNKDNHTPNYVAWELLASETEGDETRTDYPFWQDPEVEGCPTKDYDYAHTKYERGHICPAADQKWSSEAMRDCFSMANMCPQLRELNAGAWLTLENKEREWAKRAGALWIVAGPIYLDGIEQKRIGEYRVRVPDAFFKVLLDYKGHDSKAIAFVYQNGANPGNMQNYAMSVDDLEKELGYDFFPALPDDIENKIEAEFSFTEWNK